MILSSTTPQRLYLMQLGTSTIPTPPQPTPGSTGCYLVQTSDGKNILIDSGLPADYTPPPGAPPCENEKNVLEHLADLDLGPVPQTDAVLLAIDAVVLQRLFTPDRKVWPFENEEQLRASTRKLLDLVERERVAWSSLVMMVCSGKFSGKRQPITNDTLTTTDTLRYVAAWRE